MQKLAVLSTLARKKMALTPGHGIGTGGKRHGTPARHGRPKMILGDMVPGGNLGGGKSRASLGQALARLLLIPWWL